MTPWARIPLILLSALFLRLMFPAYDLHYLAWFSLVPLFVVVRKSAGACGAGLSSLAAGYVFSAALMWWGLKLDGVNPVNFGLLVLVHAWHFGAFGVVAYHFQKRIPRWNPLTFPTAWVVLEYARSHAGFLGIPWGILGYSQYLVLPVAGLSSYTGVYGVSFLLVTVNAVLTETVLEGFRSRRASMLAGREPGFSRKVAFGTLGLVLIPVGISLLLHPAPAAGKEGPRPFKVALIQGNTFWEPKRDTHDAYLDRSGGKYRDLTTGVIESRPDLIAWPSSSVPGAIPVDRAVVDFLSGIARQAGTFLLVGSAGFDKFDEELRKSKRVANSAFLFSPEGKIVDRYDKMKLFPFDEYLPLRGVFPWPSWLVSTEMKDHYPGKRRTVFDTGKARFGVLICSENLLPESFREMARQGIDFMLTMTNEGFTESTVGRHMLLAMYRLRAIENRIAIARVDTRGITCAIDPDGGLIGKVTDRKGKDFNVEGVLVAGIPLSRERSFYTRNGNLFLYVLFASLAGFGAFSVFRRA